MLNTQFDINLHIQQLKSIDTYNLVTNAVVYWNAVYHNVFKCAFQSHCRLFDRHYNTLYILKYYCLNQLKLFCIGYSLPLHQLNISV